MLFSFPGCFLGFAVWAPSYWKVAPSKHQEFSAAIILLSICLHGSFNQTASEQKMEKYRKTLRTNRQMESGRWGLWEQSRGSQEGHNNSRGHWGEAVRGLLQRTSSWFFEENKALVFLRGSSEKMKTNKQKKKKHLSLTFPRQQKLEAQDQ